jgi:hypothetical protein
MNTTAAEPFLAVPTAAGFASGGLLLAPQLPVAASAQVLQLPLQLAQPAAAVQLPP